MGVLDHGEGAPAVRRAAEEATAWVGARRHGASAAGTMEVTTFFQKTPWHCFFFSVLFLNLNIAPFGIYLRQQNIFLLFSPSEFYLADYFSELLAIRK